MAGVVLRQTPARPELDPRRSRVAAIARQSAFRKTRRENRAGETIQRAASFEMKSRNSFVELKRHNVGDVGVVYAVSWILVQCRADSPKTATKSSREDTNYTNRHEL